MRVAGPLLKDNTEFNKRFVQPHAFKRYVTGMVLRLNAE